MSSLSFQLELSLVLSLVLGETWGASPDPCSASVSGDIGSARYELRLAFNNESNMSASATKTTHTYTTSVNQSIKTYLHSIIYVI